MSRSPWVTLCVTPRRNVTHSVTYDLSGRICHESVEMSLSLVNACNAGVTLNASRITVECCIIGLLADGDTVAGNGGDGIRINASSRGNVIGYTDPVSSIDYFTA